MYFRLLSFCLLCFCVNAKSAEKTAEQAKAEDQIKVGILFFDGVQIIDFAAPYEVFGQAKYEVYTVSKNGEPVRSAMNLKVAPDYDFDTLPDVDVLLVPGGNVHDAMRDKKTLAWIRKRSKSASHTLSVCTGSHILAEAGLLDELESTTFHRALDNFEKNYPMTHVVRDKRFADNGQVITSAGLSSGLDAALHLVSKLSGLAFAKTVAMHIEYDWQPEGRFVRAQMADQYLPENNYSWPEHIEFERLYDYGDQQNWQSAYSAVTTATPEAMTESIKQAMLEHSAEWKIQVPDSAAPYKLAWKSTGKDEASMLIFEVIQTSQADQADSKVNEYTLTQSLIRGH